MHFVIQREQLLQPLQHVMGAVEKRQTMPILGNVLLKVNEDYLQLIATDLEIELHGQAPLSADLQTNFESGVVTVPARKLLDITRALPDNSLLAFSLENEVLVIKSGQSSFKLMTLPADEFPNVEEGVSRLEFNLQQKELLFLLERVYFSMAQQDVRYYLNGLLFEKKRGNLLTVATDGHRLATCSLEKELNDSLIKVIIPRKGVMELLRLLEKEDKEVTLAMGDNHIRVTGENYTYISKLIEGAYPDYQQVIPKNANKTIILPQEVLKQILTRMAILSNEKYRGVKIMLSSGKITIEAHNAEQEEASEEVAVDYEGEDLEIGFNVTYLMEVLNALPAVPIKITFTDNNSSILIEEADDDRCTYVVMPMRL